MFDYYFLLETVSLNDARDATEHIVRGMCSGGSSQEAAFEPEFLCPKGAEFALKLS